MKKIFKKKNIYLFLWLLIMTIGININRVNGLISSTLGSKLIRMPSAADLTEEGTSGEIEGKQEPNAGSELYYGMGKYKCTYYREIDTRTDIILDVYDMEGNLIKFDTNNKFQAGTWIGVNLKEVHETDWSATNFTYYEVKKQYTCKYKKTGSRTCGNWTTLRSTTSLSDSACYESTWRNDGSAYCPRTECRYKEYTCESCIYNGSERVNGYTCKYQARSCWTPEDDYKYHIVEQPFLDDEYNCPETHPDDNDYILMSDESIVKDIDKEIDIDEINAMLKDVGIDDTRKEAKKRGQYSATSIKYITNNSYPEKAEDLQYNKINQGISSRETEVGPIEEDNGASGTITKEYEILEKKVCMNVKTAKVTYGRDCNTEDGEISIENGIGYNDYTKIYEDFWHYFIPLNAKSNSEFHLKITENENTVFSVNRCLAYMQKNESDYKDTIIPANKEEVFIGDYGRYENKDLSSDVNLLKKSNGCQIAATVELPISQEFYRETESNTLKGFNFYYKTIDINNPFPNGLATTSIWQDWNENKDTNKENPDLSESFKEKTYVTTTINANEIREYNKDNQYADWTNMYTTGVSKFIETTNIVNRLVDTDSFYNLGCGPTNADWEGCKKS